jgi:6-carboxyhexanoate--CoA ligase
MWNVRVRASRKTGDSGDLHISGAEGIYDTAELAGTLRAFLMRALSHPRGMPDKIVFTVEGLSQKPVAVPLLQIKTVPCASPARANKIIPGILEDLGISKRAIDAASRVLTSPQVIRGASLITAKTGRRIEPNKDRGIRVSRLGIENSERKKLSLRLSKMMINTETVKEALILASKVAFCRDVLAEICISDDPDYTTGYVAGREIGYVRIPNIKKHGTLHGGRVFFVRDDAEPHPIINYLEREPVLLYVKKAVNRAT